MEIEGLDGGKRLLALLERGMAHADRRPILWVGAGMSIPAGYPSLSQLAERCRRGSLVDLPETLTGFELIDAFVEANGEGELRKVLSVEFSHKPHALVHEELVRLPWHAILTTNYDELLEDSLKAISKPYLPVRLEQNIDIEPADGTLPLYKVHGDVTDFGRSILTGRSYEQFEHTYGRLTAWLDLWLPRRSIVFFGCGMNDPRLLDWLHEVGPERRRALLACATVMREADWLAIPQERRALLKEANTRPCLVQEYEDIPALISELVRRLGVRPETRRLHFRVEFAPDDRLSWRIEGPGGARTVDAPWKGNVPFALALREFARLGDQPADTDKDRADLTACAMRLGEALTDALLAEGDHDHILGGDELPLVIVESSDDLILSLPWELLRLDRRFAVREAMVDLVRTTPALHGCPPEIPIPDRHLSLVVNVSAPEGHGGYLDYEAESYRVLRALYEHVNVTMTDLGTLADLTDAIEHCVPIGVHFSGHGEPGALCFENNEGGPEPVAVAKLVSEVRARTDGRLPSFFYLASCHGNTPASPDEGAPGSSVSAAELHRQGVTQVVGYFGPILDVLSTEAEDVFYSQIAEGRTTTHAVRMARRTLVEGAATVVKSVHKAAGAPPIARRFPFAWAQMVLYHRGPDNPLSRPIPRGFIRHREEALQRRFRGPKERQQLATGFIGRRRQLRRLRRMWREGRRVFVFQGMGGLGKTTLAFRFLDMLPRPCTVLNVWCREIEDSPDQAHQLTARLSDLGQELFGARWSDVAGAVDRMVDASESDRFGAYLGLLQERDISLVVHLDNMESLLHGPEYEDPDLFGEWREEEVRKIWQMLRTAAESGTGSLVLVGSCRYRHGDFRDARVPVPPMTANALFRMMGWFPALRRLAIRSRVQLVERLAGHPRAVEFLDGLLGESLRQWEDRYGERLPAVTDEEADAEWEEIIAPALADVQGKLTQDLMLEQLWQRVLDAPARRMLTRMTFMVSPWDWDLLVECHGDRDAEKAAVEATAQTLRRVSLLGELAVEGDGRPATLYEVHPATARFVRERAAEEELEALRLETCRRVGTLLERRAAASTTLGDDLDAGHYLFECGEYDRAYELLGSAAGWLRNRGRVRDALARLNPFEEPRVRQAMSPALVGRLLGTQGLAYAHLGEVQKAIEYHQQALKISREIGDRGMEGSALGNLGNAYVRLGEVQKAIEHYQQALVIAREIGDRGMEGKALGGLGLAYADLGEVQKAIEYYEQTLKIHREIGDRRGEGNDLGNLGSAYLRLGEVQKAIEYYEQALKISREIGDRRGEGNRLGNLGNAYADLGEVQKAIEHQQQALKISREIGDRRGEGNRLGNLGLAYARLGETKPARECLVAALAIGEAIADPRITKAYRTALARLDGKGE